MSKLDFNLRSTCLSLPLEVWASRLARRLSSVCKSPVRCPLRVLAFSACLLSLSAFPCERPALSLSHCLFQTLAVLSRFLGPACGTVRSCVTRQSHREMQRIGSVNSNRGKALAAAVVLREQPWAASTPRETRKPPRGGRQICREKIPGPHPSGSSSKEGRRGGEAKTHRPRPAQAPVGEPPLTAPCWHGVPAASSHLALPLWGSSTRMHPTGLP